MPKSVAIGSKFYIFSNDAVWEFKPKTYPNILARLTTEPYLRVVGPPVTDNLIHFRKKNEKVEKIWRTTLSMAYVQAPLLSYLPLW